MALVGPVIPENEWHAESWAMQHVDAAAQPTAVVTNTGRFVHSNVASWPLRHGDSVLAPLKTALIETQLSARIQTVRINTLANASDDNNRRFDVTLIPITAKLALMLARDSTLEANLLIALAASRQLFRDLALCSNDFAFETDSRAHFTYTSPGGLVGYSAQELHGAHPKSFFGHAGVASLFSAKSPITSREVWTTSKSGQDACIVVTSVPILNSDSQWCGARGIVRDLTLLRTKENEVLKARAREDLVHAIITAMRSQVEPRRMMLAAADAIAAATRSQAVTIQGDSNAMCVSIGVMPDFGHRLQFETSYGGSKNGTLKLARNQAENAFEAPEHELLTAVVPQLGVAIALSELLTFRMSTVAQVQSC